MLLPSAAVRQDIRAPGLASPLVKDGQARRKVCARRQLPAKFVRAVLRALVVFRLDFPSVPAVLVPDKRLSEARGPAPLLEPQAYPRLSRESLFTHASLRRLAAAR